MIGDEDGDGVVRGDFVGDEVRVDVELREGEGIKLVDGVAENEGVVDGDGGWGQPTKTFINSLAP